MRDSEVMRRMDNDSKSIKLALRQLGFIDMRIQAYEAVIKSRWAILQAIFNPAKLIAKINKKHLEFLRKHDEEIMKAKEIVKQDDMKPKLIVPKVYANGKQHG